MQINYKAKSINNNDWLYGSLLYQQGIPYIIPDDAENLNNISQYKANEDTICEETGLYNCGEKEIWEHDYIAENGRLYEIRKEYDCPGGCWAQSGFVLRGVDWSDFLSFEDCIDEYYNEICVRIIGNAFDNGVEEMINKAEESQKIEDEYYEKDAEEMWNFYNNSKESED